MRKITIAVSLLVLGSTVVHAQLANNTVFENGGSPITSVVTSAVSPSTNEVLPYSAAAVEQAIAARGGSSGGGGTISQSLTVKIANGTDQDNLTQNTYNDLLFVTTYGANVGSDLTCTNGVWYGLSNGVYAAIMSLTGHDASTGDYLYWRATCTLGDVYPQEHFAKCPSTYFSVGGISYIVVTNFPATAKFQFKNYHNGVTDIDNPSRATVLRLGAYE